jgi:hypothetical protein
MATGEGGLAEGGRGRGTDERVERGGRKIYRKNQQKEDILSCDYWESSFLSIGLVVKMCL